MAKFVCPNGCVKGEEHIYSHSSKFKKSDTGIVVINLRSNGCEIVCPSCSTPMEQESQFTGEAPSVATFSGLSQEDKRAVLKKRSHDHYKKEIKEYRRHVDTEGLRQSKRKKVLIKKKY